VSCWPFYLTEYSSGKKEDSRKKDETSFPVKLTVKNPHHIAKGVKSRFRK